MHFCQDAQLVRIGVNYDAWTRLMDGCSVKHMLTAVWFVAATMSTQQVVFSVNIWCSAKDKAITLYLQSYSNTDSQQMDAEFVRTQDYSV